MAQVNIRIDDNLKKQGEKLFSELGMNFSAAVSIFVSQAVRQGGIPFEVTTQTGFYNPANMKRLEHSIKQMEQGSVVVKTMDELESMADE
jgi:DNA-damage-inducible protein J